tara:strand:+ start:14663 stop:15496 length:834 start_codon:yes stop_codon:yes gene_type:complete
MYLISKEWGIETPNYFYKTTNLFTGKFYYGSGHKKKYIGSGAELMKDIELFGKKSFKHERLRFFESRQDAYDYEERFLHFIDAESNPMCYNLHNYASGAKKGQNKGMMLVVDNKGNQFKVYPNDSRIESGELLSPTKGKVMIVLENGTTKQINSEDFHKFRNATYVNNNKILLKDSNGNIGLYDKTDERYLSGELVHNTTNMVSVKHYKTNKTELMHKDDERYLSGEFVGVQKGCLVWNKKITIYGIKDLVKNWSTKFNIKVGDLQSYLEREKIEWS